MISATSFVGQKGFYSAIVHKEVHLFAWFIGFLPTFTKLSFEAAV